MQKSCLNWPLFLVYEICSYPAQFMHISNFMCAQFEPLTTKLIKSVTEVERFWEGKEGHSNLQNDFSHGNNWEDQYPLISRKGHWEEIWWFTKSTVIKWKWITILFFSLPLSAFKLGTESKWWWFKIGTRMWFITWDVIKLWKFLVLLSPDVDYKFYMAPKNNWRK